jgi:hypothetical protein
MIADKTATYAARPTTGDISEIIDGRSYEFDSLEAWPKRQFERPTRRKSDNHFRRVSEGPCLRWSEEGRETMVKTARTNPTVFFAACASLIPQDVRLEVQATRSSNSG